MSDALENLELAVLELSEEDAEYASRLDPDLFWQYMAERADA